MLYDINFKSSFATEKSWINTSYKYIRSLCFVLQYYAWKCNKKSTRFLKESKKSESFTVAWDKYNFLYGKVRLHIKFVETVGTLNKCLNTESNTVRFSKEITQNTQVVVTHTTGQSEIPRIPGQFGYKQNFCKNVVSTNKIVCLCILVKM